MISKSQNPDIVRIIVEGKCAPPEELPCPDSAITGCPGKMFRLVFLHECTRICLLCDDVIEGWPNPLTRKRIVRLIGSLDPSTHLPDCHFRNQEIERTIETPIEAIDITPAGLLSSPEIPGK